MDEKQELQLRRKAVRLELKGIATRKILNSVDRSRAWLSKWKKRFEQFGSAGLHSSSRRPMHTPNASSPALVRTIVQTRRRLIRQCIGLIGARAIQRELRLLGVRRPPSLATIKRILRGQGLIAHSITVAAYYPKPLNTVNGILHAMDWTSRYLEDGVKVYAFHTLNLRTRACTQTITSDKSGSTVIAHLFQTWQTLGIPVFLQLDNDAAFCGGYKTPRRIGQVVRLCLFFGIELIFLPVAEPECNGEIESFNGLWGRAYWERHHFTSFRQVQQTSPHFVQWYLRRYAPPALIGKTPAQAQRADGAPHLTLAQIRSVPKTLPITAGRIHFIRRVQPNGTIAFLSETWTIGRQLVGRYVWATVTTHRRTLELWYQTSGQQDWRLLKTVAYDLSETVAHLRPEFKRM
jgi:putative transposase